MYFPVVLRYNDTISNYSTYLTDTIDIHPECFIIDVGNDSCKVAKLHKHIYKS